MKGPSIISSFLSGQSGRRLFQGLVVGTAATLIVGFGFGGWNLGSTVKQKVENASQEAKVAALAPICAARFQRAANADGALVTGIKAVSSWDRNSYLIKAGWATFAGEGEPDYMVARECAALVSTALKLK